MSTQAQKKKLEAAPEPPEDTASLNGDPGPELVLSLSTAAPKRPFVMIDEKAYDMALMGDFGIVEQQLISRRGEEFLRLWNKEQLNKGERGRLQGVLDENFAKALRDVPSAVAAKLNDEDRARVVLSFIVEPQRRALAAAARAQASAAEIEEWVRNLLERELSALEAQDLNDMLLRMAPRPGDSST